MATSRLRLLCPMHGALMHVGVSEGSDIQDVAARLMASRGDGQGQCTLQGPSGAPCGAYLIVDEENSGAVICGGPGALTAMAMRPGAKR